MSNLYTPTPDGENSKQLEELLKTGMLPKDPIPVKIIGTKLLVFNKVHGSLLYGYNRFFGTPVGIRKPKSHIFDRPLELTPFEAFYLLKKKIVTVWEENSESREQEYNESSFRDYANSSVKDFDNKYAIYEDLREKKYIPRSGQKFGAHFIAYEKGPGLGHSSFCIKVKSGSAAIISSLDVVTAGRLATSVKKNFVLANPVTKTYYKFNWFKP